MLCSLCFNFCFIMGETLGVSSLRGGDPPESLGLGLFRHTFSPSSSMMARHDAMARSGALRCSPPAKLHASGFAPSIPVQGIRETKTPPSTRGSLLAKGTTGRPKYKQPIAYIWGKSVQGLLIGRGCLCLGEGLRHGPLSGEGFSTNSSPHEIHQPKKSSSHGCKGIGKEKKNRIGKKRNHFFDFCRSHQMGVLCVCELPKPFRKGQGRPPKSALGFVPGTSCLL